MEKARSFKNLIVWQKAHSFVLDVYRYTVSFPREETYSLTSQFRRAAVSVAANIAEGFRKRGKKDKARFFNIAQGSADECDYYLILANDPGYGDASHLLQKLTEVSKLLNAYTSSLLASFSSRPSILTPSTSHSSLLKGFPDGPARGTTR